MLVLTSYRTLTDSLSLLTTDVPTASVAVPQDETLITTTTTGTGSGVAALHVIQARPLWPAGPALTARLRRLITAYQRVTLRREPLLRHDLMLHDGLPGLDVGGAKAARGSLGGDPLTWQLAEEVQQSCANADTESLFLEWQRR